MSNTISLDFDTIRMSNGLTAVFIDVLILAGSRLAEIVDEKRLIVWFAEKDQSKVGMGTVDFDIREMPWYVNCFEESRRFMMKTIELAESRTDWGKLDYTPNEKLLFPVLNKFSGMLSKLSAKDIIPNALREWLDAADKDDPVLLGFPICGRYGTLLSCYGCHLCNN